MLSVAFVFSVFWDDVDVVVADDGVVLAAGVGYVAVVVYVGDVVVCQAVGSVAVGVGVVTGGGGVAVRGVGVVGIVVVIVVDGCVVTMVIAVVVVAVGVGVVVYITVVVVGGGVRIAIIAVVMTCDVASFSAVGIFSHGDVAVVVDSCVVCVGVAVGGSTADGVADAADVDMVVLCLSLAYA